MLIVFLYSATWGVNMFNAELSLNKYGRDRESRRSGKEADRIPNTTDTAGTRMTPALRWAAIRVVSVFQ